MPVLGSAENGVYHREVHPLNSKAGCEQAMRHKKGREPPTGCAPKSTPSCISYGRCGKTRDYGLYASPLPRACKNSPDIVR